MGAPVRDLVTAIQSGQTLAKVFGFRKACLIEEHSGTDEFVRELAEMPYRRGLRNRISATAEQELAGRKNYVNRHVSRKSKICTPALS
jgi:hypothetical protein